MNILILMADEFRRDAAGFGGNAIARTPCLDALAERGMVYDRMITPAPLCVPARQCLAAGKFPLRIGCEDFYSDLAPDFETFARWFSQRGYYTVACGKLHHRGPDQMQGWLHRIGGETAVRWPAAYQSRSQIGRRKWQGAADIQGAGAGVSPLGLHDDLTVQGACDFLRMHFGGMYQVPVDVPLLLLVSLQQPHFPLLAEKELFEYYLPRVSLPTFRTPPEHPALRHAVADVTDDEVRRAIAAYHALVEATDRRFARVLATMDEVGAAPKDWTIIFTSDHGDMLGSHGCWEKRSFLEESIAIPLVVQGPGVPVGRSARLSNLVDVFPTLCEIAGLPIPEGLDGRPLSQATQETFSQLGPHHFLLQRESWKYMTFGADGPDLLYDLASDPHESHDQSNNPACEPVLKEMRARLQEVLQATGALC